MSPLWGAGMPGNAKPIRRAARLDGFFPANLGHPDHLAEIVGSLTELRQGLCQGRMASYDIAVGLPYGVGPAA
ncbi:hypothetical protein [Streptomyces sviceus]|uniref:hypothetical protein n=1 Tax=Streptomyces sviceus TaxID=285530 RepID=UPI0036DFE6CC